MSDSNKTWVIGITDDLDIKRTEAKPQTAVLRPVTPRTPAESAPPPPRPQPRIEPAAPRRHRLQYAHLLLLTYLLGPFAMWLTPAGRRDRSAALLGSAAGAAGLAMILGRESLLAGVGAGWAAMGLAALAAVVIGTGFSAWARAIYLTRAEDRTRRQTNQKSLPTWLRRPWVLGVLGSLGPGAGLLLAGRYKHAALTLWLLSIGVLAAVVLAHGGWLWKIANGPAAGALQPPHVEWLLLLAGAAVAVSVLGWIVQALEGLRQGLKLAGRSTPGRADRTAMALLCVLCLLPVAGNPALVATQLDHSADRLAQEGLRIVPLGLTLAAQRLDPGRPEYTLQAGHLFAELGYAARARKCQERILFELQPVIAELEQQPAGGAIRHRPPVESETRIARAETADARSPSVADTVAVGPASAPEPLAPAPAMDEAAVREVLSRSLQAAMYGTFAIPDPE